MNNKTTMFFITTTDAFGERLWLDDHWVKHYPEEESSRLFGFMNGFATEAEAQKVVDDNTAECNKMHADGLVDAKGKPLTGKKVMQHYHKKGILGMFDGAKVCKAERAAAEVKQ